MRKSSMKKITIDLHDIFNKHHKIEETLRSMLREANDKKIKVVELIPGKGSGQLKKRVLKFLERNRDLYTRIEKDPKNWGRIFVRFK